MRHFLFTITFIILTLIFSGFFITAQAMASEEEKPKKEEEAEGHISEIYIAVPPLAVSMYHKGRPKGNMTITVVVKLENEEKREMARKYVPRLSSAYVMEASRLSYNYFDVYKPVNVAMIGDAFQRVTNSLLRHNEARVFVSDVIVNKR
ncbi:MAG: hypothetical protein K9G26_01350 [Emcibacter sp.]|nr:hypothetical protein [Emcibacter sp.]